MYRYNMSRNIRRVRRSVDSYSPSNANFDPQNALTPMTRSRARVPIPRAILSPEFKQFHGSLDARVNFTEDRVQDLDSEVNELNKTVSNIKETVNQQENRISALESGGVGLHNYNNARYLAQVAEARMREQREEIRLEREDGHESDDESLYREEESPMVRKPPIIFDGYSIWFRKILINGVPSAFWFLVPDTAMNSQVYRFSFNISAGKYVYEPVVPVDFAQIYPATPRDSANITYIYDHIPDHGFSLIPYLHLGKAPVPFNILGYRYTKIHLASGEAYCYVPGSSCMESEYHDGCNDYSYLSDSDSDCCHKKHRKSHKKKHKKLRQKKCYSDSSSSDSDCDERYGRRHHRSRSRSRSSSRHSDHYRSRSRSRSSRRSSRSSSRHSSPHSVVESSQSPETDSESHHSDHSHHSHRSDHSRRSDRSDHSDHHGIYDRTFIFGFAPVITNVSTTSTPDNYYYTVDPTVIDPSGVNYISKYPITVISAHSDDDSTADAIPLNPGVGIVLPLDTATYKISFTAELRINSNSSVLGTGVYASTPDGPIDYLQSGVKNINANINLSSSPAVIKVEVRYMTPAGVIIDTNNANTLDFTLDNMCVNTEPVPPLINLTTRTNPIVIGAAEGTYYVTCTPEHNVPFDIFYPSAALDSEGRPYGRRVVTVVATEGFSFHNATVHIMKV
jgi:hypothetical protein